MAPHGLLLLGVFDQTRILKEGNKGVQNKFIGFNFNNYVSLRVENLYLSEAFMKAVFYDGLHQKSAVTNLIFSLRFFALLSGYEHQNINRVKGRNHGRSTGKGWCWSLVSVGFE